MWCSCCAADTAVSASEAPIDVPAPAEKQAPQPLEKKRPASEPGSPSWAAAVGEKVQEVVQEVKEAIGASAHFTVVLEKTQDNGKLGMSIDVSDPTLVRVSQVSEGLVSAYNQ